MNLLSTIAASCNKFIQTKYVQVTGTFVLAALVYASSALAGNFDMVNIDIQGSRALKGASGELSKEAIEARGLEVKWHAPTDFNAFVAPLLHGKTLYIGTSDLGAAGNQGSVYALNALTGAQLWNRPIGGLFASPLISNNNLWVLDQLGGLHKLDSKTGDELCVFRPKVSLEFIPFDRDGSFAGLTQAKNMVIMSINPRDEALASPTRLGVTALIAVDDECRQIWRYYPGIPGQEGGSGIWGQPAYSHKHNMIYVSTGQTASPGTSTAGSDSLHAVDADTGEKVWQTQVRPKVPDDVVNADIWNFSIPFDPKAPIDTDIGDGPALFRGADGKEYVAAGSKRGFFYVMDAETGAIQNPGAEDPVYHTGLDLFAELGLGDPASGVIGPGIDGGVNFDSGYYRRGAEVIHFGILSDYSQAMIPVANQEPPFDDGVCFAAGQGLSPACPSADGGHLWLVDEMGTKVLGSYFQDDFMVFSPLYMDDMLFLLAANNPQLNNQLLVFDVSDPGEPQLMLSMPIEKGNVRARSQGTILTIGNGMIYAGNGREFPVVNPNNGVFAIGLK